MIDAMARPRGRPTVPKPAEQCEKAELAGLESHLAYLDGIGSPPEYRERTECLVHDSGAIYKNFGRSSWMGGQEHFAEPGALGDADLDSCRTLLTVIVRQDRFVQGATDAHVAGGLAARIVRRISELTDSAAPEGNRGKGANDG
jgi:hypothetical protein